MRRITPEQASAAYDVLVREAGARDEAWARESFVYHVAHPEHPTPEYRFQGDLGFGGKFRNNGNRGGVPYVDCYPEHYTKGRLAIIDRTNRALADLFR